MNAKSKLIFVLLTIVAITGTKLLVEHTPFIEASKSTVYQEIPEVIISVELDEYEQPFIFVPLK